MIMKLRKESRYTLSLLCAGIGVGLVGGGDLCYYFNRVSGSEAEALKNVSAYIETDHYQSASEAFNYLQSKLEIAKQNEDLVEDVGNLEKKIEIMKGEISHSVSPEVYVPVIKTLKPDVDLIIEEKMGREWNYYMGLLNTVLSLFLIGTTYLTHKKDSKETKSN